jgi:hypothetical protein
MTDRYYSLTVALEKDMRDDDAEPIINAIKMIRGVLEVKGNISGLEMWTAEERCRREIGEKLLKVVFPKYKSGND